MHVSGHDLFQALVKVSFTPAANRSGSDTQSLPTTPELQPRSAKSPAPAADAPAAALRYQKSEKTTLRLLTQEGDIVKIKIRNRSAAKVTASGGGEDGFDELQLRTGTSSKLRVMVQGHLNANELTAIQHAIGQAAEIADHFFANDVDKAFAAAESFEMDTEQLSGLKLRLRMRESALYTPTRAPLPEPVAPPPADGDADAPAEVPAPSLSDANDAAVAAATVAALAPTDGSAVTPEASTEVPAADPAAPPEASEPAPGPAAFAGAYDMGEALRAIGDFLAHVMDVVGSPAEDGPPDQLSASLKVRIVRSTVEALDQFREESRPPEPVLAGDMLEALAAQYDPPLEQVG